MNTSLFVGLCEDAELEVDLGRNLTSVTAPNGTLVAMINESDHGLYWINTYGISRELAIQVTEIVVPYSLTSIEERE
ncbi:MAG: hypothetical protein Q4A74_00225 [Cardiobacteriaceae bacterium]|nr:hypothetical protein [Cardiobacteriaceae bacterium]